MIGKSVLHYRIIDKLGAGGMGEVYRAHDTTLDRQVAIKVLPDIFSSDPERLARFEREAKLLASLNHANIAVIHGLEQAEGKRFLVMELIEGETLAQRITKGPLPVAEALEVCRQIVDGLDAAHERGVIHRDLKPANIKITPEGKVKILDFGLAKALQDETPAIDASKSPTLTDQMTRAGVILGTSAYMSPEQARGAAVDKRADIWAFGVILFELLTGRSCFPGDTVTDVLAAVVKSEPDWTALPADTPDSVQRLLRRCLTKDRKQRLRDIGDARVQMEVSPTVSTAEPAAIPRPAWRQAMPWIAGLALSALVGIAAWYLKPSQPPAAQAPAHVAIPLPPGDQLATASYPPLALSPDGSRLVYAAIRSGVQQLFVRPIDRNEAKPLPGTEGAESPFFSPNGEWIGFFAGGKLKKVSTAGGTALTLCDSGGNGGATWGSDDTIIFCPSVSSGLLRVSAAGGNPQVLTTVDRAKGENGHAWPQFLPGGKALLFTIRTGIGWDEFHIAVLRLDTGERRIVLRGGHTACFVPTGHLIYYRAGTLLAVRFNLARLEVTSSAPQTIAEGVTQSGGTIGGEYSFSAAGLLAYVPASLRQFDRRLVWVDRNGAIEPLPAPPRNYGTLSLSPDGQQVAVGIGSGEYEIWIYDVARGTPTRLTTSGGSSQVPIWTPNGKRITYRGYRAGLRNVFWKTADGTGDEERLTTGENLQVPTSWSPNGKWLAFYDSSPTTGIDIWMLRLDGERKQQPFLQESFNESNAMFSPEDGRWLAYQSNESGRTEVYVRPFPGSGAKQQISTEGGGAPRWARSGRELFYYFGNKMMAVDIKTEPTFTAGKPRILFEEQFLGYDVNQDGQRFLMVQAVEPAQPATQINVVLNWFEELKRLSPTK